MTVMASTATWTAPPIWSVPKQWDGARAFVLCGGESLKAQRHLIPHLNGLVIAVKHGVLLRPDADVLFFAGERPAEIAPPLLKVFRGQYIVVRGKGHPVFPAHSKRIGRPDKSEGPKAHESLSTDPSKVVGYDAGTSAINLATLFGAREVIVLGMDMYGQHWFDQIPQADERIQIHMQPLPLISEDAKRNGIRIVNCSPISRVECFEKRPLEEFL